MTAPDLDHAAFQQISRYRLREQDYRLRQRALDLREKRLAYEMQHKHYDIFKRTIENFTEISEIVRNKSLSPAEKMREHFIRVFGLESVEMVERANKKWAETHPDEYYSTEPDCTDEDAQIPLTPEEKQAATNEALDVMMGRPKKPAHD